MPWSVAPLLYGRSWAVAPDAQALRARWAALLAAPDEAERERLLRPSRARGLHTPVPQLPVPRLAGLPAATTRLARETGPCPDPVRVLHGAFDQQWLIPDHRLIDAARPELWRVADERQIFAVEQARIPNVPGPALSFSAVLPDGRSPAGKPGRIRPLYRRPGGQDPNLAPGLTELLGELLGLPVTAEDVLAWITVAGLPGRDGVVVPLTRDPDLWLAAVGLGRTTIWLHTRGERCADPAAGRPGGQPRLPGGRRPYVRAPLPGVPRAGELEYDPEQQALRVGAGLVSPVPAAAWDFHAGGVRVLEAWYERRTAVAAPGTLEALRPSRWTRATTTELLELVSVLAMLAELRPERRRLAERLEREAGARRAGAAGISADALRRAGVLPAPVGARRPASVLDHHEEGPDGQFALL
ncbi:DNA methyltransferase [Streptomyces sp. H10-C2]|uniref:type ISP restriction/modification enzyme n=1 Tax=unclassified Streptomyces TaxID=2593676 RepID=UPI0024BB752F|nr:MULTISPECIES: type ISP restriction/modification enzyme [unclassified Streptomyces]MDJ0343116.1 DNA methyltransferase [Streptomyces sp. PH10-H1]MDJ0371058.1 DNA methyltransferase [Streptomyces sp. H10-C2]